LKKVLFIIGSGATYGLSVKMRNSPLNFSPTDQGFWEKLGEDKCLSYIEPNFPALTYFLKFMDLWNFKILKLHSLESIWNLVDVIFKHLNYSKNYKSDPIYKINKKDFDEILRFLSCYRDNYYNGKYIGEKKMQFSKYFIDIYNAENNQLEKETLLTGLAGWDLRNLIAALFSVDCENFSFNEKLVNTIFNKKILEILNGIVTFNYDVFLEKYLLSKKMEFYYPHSNDKHLNSSICITKLHGSLNWKHNYDGCIEVSSNNLQTCEQGFRDVNAIESFQQCAIISPVIFKQELNFPDSNRRLYRTFSKIWQCAAEKIYNSTHIVMYGYGFPKGDYYLDSFFKFYIKKKKDIKIANINIENSNTNEFNQRINMIFGTNPFFIDIAKEDLIEEKLNSFLR